MLERDPLAFRSLTIGSRPSPTSHVAAVALLVPANFDSYTKTFDLRLSVKTRLPPGTGSRPSFPT
jgi:hypothetical protein